VIKFITWTNIKIVNMADEQLEIQKQFRQQQEKYVYYVIALAVAAIGFSVLKTNGQPLRFSQIPLAMAVLSWGLSIFCGLRFLKLITSTLYANNTLFDIMEGRHPEVGNHPQLIEAASSGLRRAMEINSNRASRLVGWQNRLFYFGISCFIAWHIWEMYLVWKPH
jgi:hypothetical protein